MEDKGQTHYVGDKCPGGHKPNLTRADVENKRDAALRGIVVFPESTVIELSEALLEAWEKIERLRPGLPFLKEDRDA